MNQKEEFLKKVRYLLFAIFLCAPLTAVAQGDIAINEENFPDENFRAYLLEQSYGQDGIITEEEIKGITYIYVSSRNIGSLKGIEYFTALTSLRCEQNQLTSLDVSHNTALTSLGCGGNQLTSLDISQNTALTDLWCYSNQLTSLDVSQNTALTGLYCWGNRLTSLDVSKNTALTSLECASNQLTSLDVSKNTALTELSCGSNQLASLDVSQNMALTQLVCASNQLTSLDVSRNTALTGLYCWGNRLTSLDVLQNTALTQLRCDNNQLALLDVSQNTALTKLQCYGNQLTSLDVSKNTALTELQCYCNQIKGEAMDLLISSLPENVSGTPYTLHLYYSTNEGNVCTKAQVAAAKAKGWTPYYYNGGWKEYEGIEIPENVAINEINFPDENFRNWILEQDYGKDGVLTGEEIIEITQISVIGQKISSLKGIEYFTALTYLQCGGNLLTSLDVSKNTALTSLACKGQQLEALDLSKNVALRTLDCRGNKLKTLILSNNTVLSNILCDGNHLTSLDVSACSALSYITCFNNLIKGEAMEAFINSLPQYTSGQSYRIDIYNNYKMNNYDDEGNVCTKAQVAAAKAKGWTPYYYNGKEWVEYEGSDDEPDVEQPDGIAIDEVNFPDENFRAYLLEQSYGQDGIITEEEIKGITAISVSNKNIGSLKGIEYFTALTSLQCEQNQLTSLDMSHNTALTFLDCLSNQLTNLNISKNTALTYLRCKDNQLPSLDVSQNTALTLLNCGRNKLTSLDISQNTALTELDCTANLLTSLDISNNTALTRLYCTSNQLASLDISQNTALTEMNCISNRLTSLDVSQNTALTTLYCSSNQLAALDVSQNTVLTRLYCDGNQLTSLDVSQNTALTELRCYSNQIKGEAMETLISSLPENVSGTPYTLYLYHSTNEGNVCTKAQVEVAKAKGWLPCYSNGAEYSGELPEDIIINATNFPDENFRNWLLKQNYGKDGVLTGDEIIKITRIDVSSQNISTLKGIEYFFALTSLYCNNNQLTSLDVSKNTLLRSLECYSNQIKGEAMDSLISSLPKNTMPQKPYVLRLYYPTNDGNICTKEQVAAAKAKGWTPYCYNGKEWVEYEGSDEEPDVEQPEGIVIDEAHFPDENFRNYLQMQSYGKDGIITEEEINGITAIVINNHNIANLKGIEYFTALTFLNCSNNQLTSLDVSKNTALTFLYCSENNFTELDLSQNTALTWLQCYANQLTSLDVSHNAALTTLYCYNNQIKGEAMDALISSLPQNVTDSIYIFYVYYSDSIRESNICTKAQVAAAKAQGWTSYYYDGKSWVEYEGSDDEPEVEQPEGVAIDETTFPDEAFRSWLVVQECGKDSILTDEEIKGITSIDVSGQGITSLKGIELFTALTTLDCSMNQLTEETVTELLSSLPKTENGTLRLYDDANDGEGNVKVLTDAQVALAQENGWTLYYYNGTEWVEYGVNNDDDDDNGDDDGDDNGDGDDDDDNNDDNNDDDGNDDDTPETPGEDDVVMNEETFPDEGFRDILAELVGAKDGDVLTEEEIKEITSLDISEAGISDLTGIEHLTALTELVCEGNKLESLDVSKNTALTMIDCSRNQISGEAMDAFISSLPAKTAAARAAANDAAEVYVLRVYDSTADDEGNVCTKAQVEAIKAKGWTPYYYNGSEWLEYTGYDDETTGISWLGTGDGSVSVYNMAGQKVNLPANAKKGVYIVNGKKVVVK